MSAGMHIAFFGSSLVSSYWNGAATYYRGLLSALAARGHRIDFYEPDAYERQSHRDLPFPSWARVTVYSGSDPRAALRALDDARRADLVVKASGVGVFDELLEREALALASPRTSVAFWDVDAPATLERVAANPHDPFRALIPRYDQVFTYGGGERVVDGYLALGARTCVPVYNALDPATHHPVPPQPRFEASLALLANRLPDREARVREFFFEAARRRPSERFLLGGSGWNDGADLPANVSALGHVATHEHNALNCSARAVLNVNRESMARFGSSPPTRIFEAAGAGACIITDMWEGIDDFLEPGAEVLCADTGEEVAAHLGRLTPERARAIGAAARRRVLADHTYARRAAQVDAVLQGLEADRTTWRLRRVS